MAHINYHHSLNFKLKQPLMEPTPSGNRSITSLLEPLYNPLNHHPQRKSVNPSADETDVTLKHRSPLLNSSLALQKLKPSQSRLYALPTHKHKIDLSHSVILPST